MAESAWLADLQRTVYPNKWSPISCRSSAGQGKFAGQRPTFYQLCHATNQWASMAWRQQTAEYFHEVPMVIATTSTKTISQYVTKWHTSVTCIGYNKQSNLSE